MKAILVTGARDYVDREEITSVIRSQPSGTIVIQGYANGADMLAKLSAEEYGYPGVTVPYFKWLGKAGGPVRNRVMLQLLLGLQAIGYDVEVHAFHPDLSKSRGTKDMVKQAERAGLFPILHR